jgi:hypothetical protein
MLPSALSRSDSFRSVHVGRPQFSRCCHLFGDLSFSLSVETWARRLTQSPELGFGLLSFSLPGMILTLLLPFVFTQPLHWSWGCCCATVRTLLRSPTGDAVTLPASLPWPRWLASFRFFHHDSANFSPQRRPSRDVLLLPGCARFSSLSRIVCRINVLNLPRTSTV